MKSEAGIKISQINQMTSRVIDRLIAENGTDAFSAAQGKVLSVLWDHDGIIIQELAGRTGLAQNTLTSMLDRLEKADLCERRPDPSDRRKTRICLSEKGRTLRPVFESVTEQMFELYFDGFSEKDIHTFETLLDRVIANLSRAL